MGVVIKQSFWGTFIAYLGVIVGYFNALYLRAEHFELEQIGLFQLVTANAMMVAPLSSFGMASSFMKFFPAFDSTSKNRFFTFLFLITIVGNLVVLALGYSLKDLIALRYVESAPAYISYLSITAIIMVSNSLFELFFSYSRTIFKVVFPSFLRDIYLRSMSLMLVLGYAMNWWDFDSAVMGLGLTYSTAFLFLFVQLMIQHGFRFDFRFDFITSEWRRKLVNFGGYSMLMAGSFALINNVSYDQIASVLGPDLNGIFSTCFFIALIIEMPRRNMAKVITPILSTEIEQKNLSEVKNLYKRSSITMSVIGLLLFIGITTNLNDLFEFIPKGAEFRAGFWVVVCVCSAKLVLMISSFAGEIINFSSIYRFNLYFQLAAAALLIILNYWMIPLWGINGAAISYLAALLFHILLKVGFVSAKFGFLPLVKAHFPLLIVGFGVGILAFFFNPDLHPVVVIIIRSFFTSVLYITLVYYLNISEDINKLIRSTFGRFVHL